MFNQADVMIDEFARPIFVIEDNLAAGDIVMEFEDDNKVSFLLNSQKVGELEDLDDRILLLSLMQDEIGVIAHAKGEECPDYYTHIAKVISKMTESVS